MLYWASHAAATAAAAKSLQLCPTLCNPICTQSVSLFKRREDFKQGYKLKILNIHKCESQTISLYVIF